MTCAAARCMFVKYIERAGLAHKGYTLHCLRHAFASELLNAGMPFKMSATVTRTQQRRCHSSLCQTHR